MVLTDSRNGSKITQEILIKNCSEFCAISHVTPYFVSSKAH